MSRQFDDNYNDSGQYLVDYALTEWAELGINDEYAVCKEGYVCHFRPDKGPRMLKPHKGDLQGHLNVRIPDKKTKKVKEYYIHRLVAEHFLPHRLDSNKTMVRHLDDVKEHNHIDNLAWGDAKDNHDDAVRNGLYIPVSDEDREKGLEKQRKPVMATNLKTGEEKWFRSQTDAARELGLQQANVGKVLYSQRKHTGGYTFKFVPKEENIND